MEIRHSPSPKPLCTWFDTPGCKQMYSHTTPHTHQRLAEQPVTNPPMCEQSYLGNSRACDAIAHFTVTAVLEPATPYIMLPTLWHNWLGHMKGSRTPYSEPQHLLGVLWNSHNPLSLAVSMQRRPGGHAQASTVPSCQACNHRLQITKWPQKGRP
jgi:hypothetical protein